MKTETYQLAAGNGRPIRKATKVVFEDGREVRFIEKIPNYLAIPQAVEILKKRERPESKPSQAERRADEEKAVLVKAAPAGERIGGFDI